MSLLFYTDLYRIVALLFSAVQVEMAVRQYSTDIIMSSECVHTAQRGLLETKHVGGLLHWLLHTD